MTDIATERRVLSREEFEAKLAELPPLLNEMNGLWRVDNVREGPETFSAVNHGGTLAERQQRRQRETAAMVARSERQGRLEDLELEAQDLCKSLSVVTVKLTV